MKVWLILLTYSAIWAAAFLLAAGLTAVSTSLVSRLLFALAALVAARHLINGPFTSSN